MRLRIGERKGRTPRSPDDHPASDAVLVPDQLHVSDQMLQAVVLAAGLGAASAGAALIEQDGVETLGVEQPAVIGLAAAAGSTVQIDRGDAPGSAHAFDVNLVAIAGR